MSLLLIFPADQMEMWFCILVTEPRREGKVLASPPFSDYWHIPFPLGVWVCVLKESSAHSHSEHRVQKLHISQQSLSCTFLTSRNQQVIVPCWQTEDFRFKGKEILVIYSSLIEQNCQCLCK